MSSPVTEKLKIRPDTILLALNPPPDFRRVLGELPSGTLIDSKASDYDQIHWFVLNKAQLEKELSKVLKMLRPGILVWVYYPKVSSSVQTDLSRDKGWDKLLKEDNKLTWINLISFDDTWSAFGFRAKTEADKKKTAKPAAPKEISKWADPSTREVKIPEDLLMAFKKDKKAFEFFKGLSYSNKKEYIEWIVTAKKQDTRDDRVAATVEKLDKEWKNPRNL